MAWMFRDIFDMKLRGGGPLIKMEEGIEHQGREEIYTCDYVLRVLFGLSSKT